jgi:hypothetical protein
MKAQCCTGDLSAAGKSAACSAAAGVSEPGCRRVRRNVLREEWLDLVAPDVAINMIELEKADLNGRVQPAISGAAETT